MLAVLLNILLNYLLIPQYAQNGAAAASVVSEVALNVYMLLVMSKVVRFRFDRRAVVQSVVSTGLMALCVCLVGKLPVGMLWQFLLMVGVGIGIYVLANICMGNEILTGFLRKFLNRRKHQTQSEKMQQ